MYMKHCSSYVQRMLRTFVRIWVELLTHGLVLKLIIFTQEIVTERTLEETATWNTWMAGTVLTVW